MSRDDVDAAMAVQFEGFLGKRWLQLVILVAALIVIGAGIVLTTSYTWLASPARVEAASAAFQRKFNAKITVGAVTELRVLPRPHVTVRDVTFTTEDGAISLLVPSLRVRLSLSQLLAGRLKFDRIQLTDAVAVIDLDALAAIGARRESATTDPIADNLLIPDRLVMTSGHLELKSTRFPAGSVSAEAHADLNGLRSGIVTATGTLSRGGERGDFSVHLDSLSDFLGGRGSSGFARYKSALVVASANGSLPGGWLGGFSGSVSLTSPHPAALLASVGLGGYAIAGVEHVSFTGAAEANDTGVSISNAKLIVNKTTLEGTLGWQYESERAGLVGTLATNVLDLDAFAGEMPALSDGKGAWSAETIDFGQLLGEDIDLRVSANRVRLGGIEVEDAALSALCRDGRLELSLGEARAYGGLVKGRLFTSDMGDVIDLKADASWSQVELDQLPTRIALAPGRLTGSSSGHVSLVARGPNVVTMIGNSEGAGQASIRQGTLSGLPGLEAALRSLADLRPAPKSGERSFDLAAMDFTIDHGVLTTTNATLSGPDLHASLRGQVSFLDRSFSVSQAPSQKDGTAASAPSADGESGTGREAQPAVSPAGGSGAAGGLLP